MDRAVALSESCRLVNVPACSGFADPSGRRAWCRRAKAVSLGENGWEQPCRNRTRSKARNDFVPAGELSSESWDNPRERQSPAYQRKP